MPHHPREEEFLSQFQRRFDRPFPQPADSNIQQFAQTFERLFDEVGFEMAEVTKSRFLWDAEPDEVAHIGARYGTLGRRRGRGIGEYRRYVSSLREAFRGRGTEQGLSFAVSAGAGADSTDDVEVIDRTETTEYTLRLHSWSMHSSQDLRNLAEMADPAAVELQEPVEYEPETDSVGFEDAPVEIERTPPADSVGFRDGDIEVISHDYDRFDGSAAFDGEDTFDPDE